MTEGRCGASTRAAGRRHVCSLPADHDLEGVEQHRSASGERAWQGRPWRVQTNSAKEVPASTLDHALHALLWWQGDRKHPGAKVRIVRPGWSGCLVPAGKHPADGVHIEPYAVDDSPNTTADRDKWLKALMRTSAWRNLPQERPLVPGDPEAMERWESR